MPKNEHAHEQELHSAIADLQNAVKMNSNYAEALYILSMAYLASNESDSARSFFLAAAKLDPRYYRSELASALNNK